MKLTTLLAAGLSVLAASCSAPSKPEPGPAAGAHAGAAVPAPVRQPGVPPYLPPTPTQNLPRVLPADSFRDEPTVAKAYAAAARIPAVVAQQPCYCGCDGRGHTSLLDCFASTHGAACTICLKEVLLADAMTREGASATDVRQAIMQGAWKSVAVEDRPHQH
jgi:hypothetical protein